MLDWGEREGMELCWIEKNLRFNTLSKIAGMGYNILWKWSWNMEHDGSLYKNELKVLETPWHRIEEQIRILGEVKYHELNPAVVSVTTARPDVVYCINGSVST